MLVQLAGAEAEFLLSGSRWTGLLIDTAAWTQLATAYLAYGFGGVFFFSQPVTDTEMKYNVSAYDRLRETQKAALAEFLTQNRGILEELAQLLAAKRLLNLQEMRPLFDKVQFTPAIPRVHLDTIRPEITHQTAPDVRD